MITISRPDCPMTAPTATRRQALSHLLAAGGTGLLVHLGLADTTSARKKHKKRKKRCPSGAVRCGNRCVGGTCCPGQACGPGCTCATAVEGDTVCVNDGVALLIPCASSANCAPGSRCLPNGAVNVCLSVCGTI